MALLDDYLTRDELASELGITSRTLIRWQALPDGIPFTELGGRVLYRRASIRSWLEKQERWPNPRGRAR